jgi:hypothetical protein
MLTHDPKKESHVMEDETYVLRLSIFLQNLQRSIDLMVNMGYIRLYVGMDRQGVGTVSRASAGHNNNHIQRICHPYRSKKYDRQGEVRAG